MSAPPAGRRRERGRGGAGGRTSGIALPLAPLPRLEVRSPPLECLTGEQVERIVAAAFRLLAEAGLEIRHAGARATYRRAGALVDDDTGLVRLGRDIVEGAMASAPERFVLHARNPERHLHVGGRVVNFGPVNGAPHVSDAEGGRRYGDIAAFRDILRVTHALGVLHWQGGVVVEPVDLPVPVRHLAMYRAHVECSDIVWAARGVGGVQARDALAMSAIEHGCAVEDLAARPTLMTVTNVNSPRRVDEEILDNILVMAAAGQCVVITPFTLMGAMAPVTLAGALVQQTAEALGIMALCQLVRPGTPVVMGGFTSNVDMRTGAPAFGTPEYVNAALATAQIARRFRVPVRTSAVNASPAVDAQATYETAFSLQAAILSHSHLINHAAGWLEGGLTASMEKIVVDAEMLRAWAEILRPVEFGDDELAVDAIKDVAPGGHFFGSPHTLARYEHAFWRPLLSDWSNFENWSEAGSRDATRRAADLWKRLRDAHVPPPLDPGVGEALDAYVARRTREIEREFAVTRFIANARMYAVSPDAEEAWRALIARVAGEAGVALDYEPYPAPAPLEVLWRRSDLGCVLMCGYPVALGLANVVPIAAPVPRAPWAAGRAVYRSDLIVRADSPFRTLEDTFGHRAGWTVEHSHSGFNAFRRHLLAYRTPERPALFGSVTGHLVTARRILDAVREGSIDVGPLDSYWHLLIARHRPELTDGIRVVASTDVAPIPAFVAAPGLPAADVAQLRDGFAAAAGRPWFAPFRDTLGLDGFSPVDRAGFATTLAWDREAIAAGYPVPA